MKELKEAEGKDDAVKGTNLSQEELGTVSHQNENKLFKLIIQFLLFRD